ncbi:hypothetical protein AAE478_005520 [Parahypoxylon ruwenzoriense]
MAVNAPGSTSGQGKVIDLTAINDEEEDAPVLDIFDLRPSSVGLHFPPGLSNGQDQKTTPSSLSTPIITSTVPIPKHVETHPSATELIRYVSSTQPLPSASSFLTQERPSKRRKLSDDAGSRPALPVTDTKALTRCLQNQVFPHLERAIKKLNKNIYDVERLGGKIIGKIADRDFERHFHLSNGRLPPDIEAFVIIRIDELVTELTKGNEFRRRPIAVKPHPPAPKAVHEPTPRLHALVLPSIEEPPNGLSAYDDEEDDQDQYILDDSDGHEEAESQRVQTSPPRVPVKKPRVTRVQQLRTRVKAQQWQSGKSYQSRRESSPFHTKNGWFGLSSRPYLPAGARKQVALGIGDGRLLRLEPDELRQPCAYHVDFADEEVKYLRYLARSLHGRQSTRTWRTDLRDLRHLLKRGRNMRDRILDIHREGYDRLQRPPSSISKRSVDDIRNFLDDLHLKQVNPERKSLYIERDDNDAQSEASRANTVPSLLLAREITSNRLGATRRYQNFTTAFRSNREDYMEPKVEWTNCAGDIMTISWLSNATHFVCGTTTHSDSHNQQYNKPGNLLLGSAISNTLRAYPDHRIPRPLVSHGDNSLESMRESQDPWLYTSVVSSDYDPVDDLAFTSSFDNTVKVWKLKDSGMMLVDTWHHNGRVNFVVASKGGRGKVATAADVPTRAVRVYSRIPSEENSAESRYPYHEYSCKRVHGEDYVPSDKWAYFPAAIRWGLAPDASHLLLIGYSPRSLRGDDNEIPEDRRDTGELCLWDTNSNTEVKVNSGATQNVFEVAWHPSRRSFAAATSASQTSEKIEEHVRTQIRIFELNEMTGQYGAVKTLNCPAIDINELLIRPNSILYSYVAAGCTDGRVYIWDSAGSDDPMCVLEHGDPVEEFIGDREQEDVGVKFMAWATTTDRLYTGSSDGVVKVWNIRHGEGILVRDLIEVAAPITAGAFSPDYTRLVIGDGSGRVYLMDLEDDEDQSQSAAISSGFLSLQFNGKRRVVRRPRPYIPHDELPPPGDLEASSQPKLQIGQERAKEYLSTSRLVMYPDATIGAVQGPAYAETKLYRAEAHLDGNMNQPLLSGFEHFQRINQTFSRTTRLRRQMDLGEISQSLRDLHSQNELLDLDIESLDANTRSELVADRAELDVSPLDLDYDSSCCLED